MSQGDEENHLATIQVDLDEVVYSDSDPPPTIFEGKEEEDDEEEAKVERRLSPVSSSSAYSLESLDSLPPHDDPTCSVCLSSLKVWQAWQLPCGHWFHTHCIIQSLRFSHRCPYCRDDGRRTERITTTTRTTRTGEGEARAGAGASSAESRRLPALHPSLPSSTSTGSLTALQREDGAAGGESPPETLPRVAMGNSREAQRIAAHVRMLRRTNNRMRRMWAAVRERQAALKRAADRVSRERRRALREALRPLKTSESGRAYFNAAEAFRVARARYAHAEAEVLHARYGEVVPPPVEDATWGPLRARGRDRRPVPPDPPHPETRWFWKA